MYKIVRFFTTSDYNGTWRRTIKTGLSLEEARAHCNNPETSSSTATGRLKKKYANLNWFDGYDHV